MNREDDEYELSIFGTSGTRADPDLVRTARENLMRAGIPPAILNTPCNALFLTDDTMLYVVIAFLTTPADSPILHVKRFEGPGSLTDAIAVRISQQEYGFESPYVVSVPLPKIIEESPRPDPPDLIPFIERFKVDHPKPHECGFIIMRFAATSAHREIVTYLKNSLSRLGLRGLRADDKSYCEDLFSNIRTYMHCCGFGIAVFERLLTDDFNPNVSLEVGYMLALNKPVLLLKDTTLRGLHSDLVGRLYTGFDTQHVNDSLNIERWLLERGILLRS